MQPLKTGLYILYRAIIVIGLMISAILFPPFIQDGDDQLSAAKYYLHMRDITQNDLDTHSGTGLPWMTNHNVQWCTDHSWQERGLKGLFACHAIMSTIQRNHKPL